MKKILLIGKLNEILRSLNECLMEDFQVQICSEQIENVEAMLNIIKPDLFIVCQIGVAELDMAILQCMEKHYANIPVLIIGINEHWDKYEEYCQKRQFDKIFRPVKKNELLKKCYEMLKLKNLKPYEEEIVVPKKILIVDDSSLVLRNMKTILEEKYTVLIATSGEQTIKFVQKKHPDLILLDYEMPGWDGKKTYEMLKADKEIEDIPVIFLTSKADKEHIYSALETRPAGYILKPPDRDRLFSSIEEALNN